MSIFRGMRSSVHHTKGANGQHASLQVAYGGVENESKQQARYLRSIVPDLGRLVEHRRHRLRWATDNSHKAVSFIQRNSNCTRCFAK